MLTFYQQLANQQPIPQAFYATQVWLRQVSVADLQLQATAYLQQNVPRRVQEFLKTWLAQLSKMNPEDTPYSDPYHWATFTLTGLPHATPSPGSTHG